MGPWHFGDFRYIFLPNRGEDQKKVLPSERGDLALCHLCGKSIPGYCITLYEGLRLQL